jgi:hypothetical protein
MMPALPAAGPSTLCAWLQTYAQRLREGVYTVSCTRARFGESVIREDLNCPGAFDQNFEHGVGCCLWSKVLRACCPVARPVHQFVLLIAWGDAFEGAACRQCVQRVVALCGGIEAPLSTVANNLFNHYLVVLPRYRRFSMYIQRARRCELNKISRFGYPFTSLRHQYTNVGVNIGTDGEFLAGLCIPESLRVFAACVSSACMMSADACHKRQECLTDGLDQSDVWAGETLDT